MNTFFDKKTISFVLLGGLAGGLIYLNQNNQITSSNQSEQNLFDKADKVYKNGLYLYKTQKYTQATDEFKKAISMYNKHIPAHNRLSLSYLRLGRTDTALASCKKAIEINPQFATSHVILGQIYQHQNNRAEALKAYETAVKLDENLFEAHAFLAGLLATDQSKEELEHAARHAKLAYDLQPNNTSLLATLKTIKSGLDSL